VFAPLTFDPVVARITLFSDSPRAAACAMIGFERERPANGAESASVSRWHGRCGRPNGLEFGVH
jgi:hypothetical protein